MNTATPSLNLWADIQRRITKLNQAPKKETEISDELATKVRNLASNSPTVLNNSLIEEIWRTADFIKVRNETINRINPTNILLAHHEKFGLVEPEFILIDFQTNCGLDDIKELLENPSATTVQKFPKVDWMVAILQTDADTKLGQLLRENKVFDWLIWEVINYDRNPRSTIFRPQERSNPTLIQELHQVVPPPTVSPAAEKVEIKPTPIIQSGNIEATKQCKETIEANWDAISAQTGVYRKEIEKPDSAETELTYFFNKVKTYRNWGSMNDRKQPITSYPNRAFIKNVLGCQTIQSARSLARVWSALGFRIATATEEKEEEKLKWREGIESNWDNISKQTGVYRKEVIGADPNQKKLVYFFDKVKTSLKWGRISVANSQLIESYPTMSFIQNILGASKIHSAESLAKVWKALGLEEASEANYKHEETHQKIPEWRKVIENNWTRISKQTGVYRRKVAKSNSIEKEFAYFFDKTIDSIKWGRVNKQSINLNYYPNVKFLKNIINKEIIQSSVDLAKVWEALGLRKASEEDYKAEWRRVIETNWNKISAQTGVYRRKIAKPDSKEKEFVYFFDKAKAVSNWKAFSKKYNNIATYPNQIFIKKIIGGKLKSGKDLAKVWGVLGLRIASQEDYKEEWRKVIETNWNKISAQTGVYRRKITGSDSKEKEFVYFFDRLKNSNNWGKFSDKYLRIELYPNNKFIKDLTGNDYIHPDDLAKVWKALGLRSASHEDYKAEWRRIIETNWNKISAQTGIYRKKITVPNSNEKEFVYFFDRAQNSNKWGKFNNNHNGIRSYPNDQFIKKTANVEHLRSKKDLAKVWSALGLNCKLAA